MSLDSFLLVSANFAAIGLLPRVFFRRDGRLNRMWWLTAAPFLGSYALQVGAVVGWITALGPGPAATVLRATGVVVSACSIALIALTAGSHRLPPALWHQHDDTPGELVTWGPYRRVRHPFYAAFLLALGAGALVTPHPGTVAALAGGTVLLNVTARREERRLMASPWGEAYRAYARRTGRLLPGLRRLPA